MARIVKAPDERRMEFIETAQTLFYTKGYERTSVNDIIEAVGVSKGAFYYYFESKTAVLEAIVDEIIERVLADLQEIIADETLPAIAKWQKALQVSNNWKLERKEEMIAASRLMQMDENILLQHKIRAATRQVVISEMAKIITQGVDEGVFSVQHVLETTEILLGIISTLSSTVNELIFNQENYEDPAAIALRKKMAVETAVERLLSAPPGSMSIVDDEALTAWFVE